MAATGDLAIDRAHGDAILAGDVSQGRLVKMGLTVMVPYLVSTFSSVGATRDVARRR